MIPSFTSDGLLPPGVHEATWSEISTRFGYNFQRLSILAGLRTAANTLAGANCRRLWIDGSFVTGKKLPSDWDGCWDPIGVNPGLLDPAFLDPSPAGRQIVKVKYLADLFPASVREAGKNLAFLEYFQIDKLSGSSKGLVLLNLRTLQS
jgi:hypothetical protein